ncbi:MAG: Smr/MutS family protein [Pseudomonadota bacterium]
MTPAARSPRPGAPQVAVQRARSPYDALDPAAGLDRRTADRLRRGKRTPEARLDLHGMTADRAHAALGAFLRRARAEGKRCVLVITGKGGRKPAEDAPYMPERTGVLRYAVPEWLSTAPLSPLVVGVYKAHQTHGGEGALYVYLRKPRP